MCVRPDLIFMLNTPIDQFAPNRFSDSFRQPLSAGLCKHFGDNILNTPRQAHGVAIGFDASCGLDIALTLGQQRDQHAVETIDAGPHLVHRFARFRGNFIWRVSGDGRC